MISREELHQLAWSEPMTKIAERFEVSSSYLARIYTMLNVPRPERGYWQKLAVGKAPQTVPLPKPQQGDELYWTRDGEVAPRPRAAPPRRERAPTPRPSNARVREIKSGPHELVRGAKPLFEKSYPIKEGEYLKPYKKILVDITTSQACLDKALELASDLFNAFETAGHRVTLPRGHGGLRRRQIDEREKPGPARDPHYHRGPWTPDRPTVVYIDDVAVGLAIVEMSEEVLLRYVNGKYIRETDYNPPKSTRYRVDHTWTTRERFRPAGSGS